MQKDELRKLIRDAIALELRRDPGGREPARDLRDEVVSIGSDAALAAFVRRLLALAEDRETREDIRAGRLRFRLEAVADRRRSEVQQLRPAQEVRLAPLVTEKQVDALPEGTRVLQVSKKTRFTPLAQDRLRARKITIERADP